jgi:SPP1 gp7 family putative phage head morphogenesis protein
MSNVLAKDFTHSNEIASSIINGHMPEVYAMGHNWGAYECEIVHGLSAQISFTLYDRRTVERLIRNSSISLLPEYPAEKLVDVPKSMIWNKQQINSAITQGILQGDRIDTIADRLQSVSNMNRDSAIRNARTMTTSAENGGRISSYMQAQEMGIELEKEWVATLDGRTRESHRYLDGETIPVSKTFSNGCRYPADPRGDPAEVYNCRCTLCSVMPKYKVISNKQNLTIEGMTYDQWKKEKPVYKVGGNK